MLFLILLAAGLLILFFMEAPQLWKQKLIPDLVVYCSLMLISTYMGLAQIYNWKIPNPVLWLYHLFGLG